MDQPRRPRVLDIALEAGVSTATVDRVINDRGGVSARTLAVVQEAEARLAASGPMKRAGADRHGDAPPLPCDLVLPAQAGLSTDYLAAAMAYFADRHEIALRLRWVNRMNPEALAVALRDIVHEGSAGVAFQALEHPQVIEAAVALRDGGIPVVTVVSGLASSRNFRHVGLDNRGAGRTAAFLLGSFLADSGRVAVIWSGSLSRAHEERESGFRTLLREEFPAIEVVDIDIGRHEPAETLEKLGRALSNRTFAGAYCVGAGLASLVDAVSVLPELKRPRLIGHNLTENTRQYLLDRTVAAIIHQDMVQIAEEVVAGLADATRVDSVTVPTVIVTRENLDRFLDLRMLRSYLSK